jgi:ADP-heptose:LPS heptosyltransferase
MRKILLKANLALGDVVCFSAVPRELAIQYPGQFDIAVETPFPELFIHNPHIIQLEKEIPMPGWSDPKAERERWIEWKSVGPDYEGTAQYILDATLAEWRRKNAPRVPATNEDRETIECHYDRDLIYSVHRSNQHSVHLLTAYCRDVANSLGLSKLYPDTLAGDIHLSKEEYGTQSKPHQLHNVQRYWLISAGGKSDATVKFWVPGNYQRVVDYFRGRIQFVQVGSKDAGHWSPDLKNVIDLRGQTTIRELVQLVHASCGVLCGITSFMHLAAAVPRPMWQKRQRPCVVIAGGREPRTWYGYPTHRILETVGALPCCATGGCWQSHTMPIDTTKEERLCERVIDASPKCMHLIRPEQVILAIEQYLEGECIS